ncbi:hypothetical protein GBAR_LOCUS18449 [Geodia barretti]|uniref:Uncharacterized protein n=1 Tax=Geodia barretti TaxID=519541 RepID=A0AA35WSZ4_GEOBA|nr:hypothetical protein GBAR_LOCUS18449 [Geodia barretti]
MRVKYIPIAMAAMPTPIVQYNVCDPQILVACLFHTGAVSGFSVMTICIITNILSLKDGRSNKLL